MIDNALRYSPYGTSIELSIEERDRWCLIAVRDHGPGFSETDLDRLFERFYRGDPARARGPRNGSGLGLAIVRQIALSQGGLVRARNIQGEEPSWNCSSPGPDDQATVLRGRLLITSWR